MITSSRELSAVPTTRATWCRLVHRATTDAEVPWEGGSRRSGDGSVEANAIPATWFFKPSLLIPYPSHTFRFPGSLRECLHGNWRCRSPQAFDASRWSVTKSSGSRWVTNTCALKRGANRGANPLRSRRIAAWTPVQSGGGVICQIVLHRIRGA